MTDTGAVGLAVPAAPADAPSVDLEPVPERALAICAHPDDGDFYVAGTFAKWAAAGCECTYAVMTDGSKGSWGDHDSEELRAIRADEQRAAAAALGVSEVVFLGYEDGFLEAGLDVRRRLAEVIRRTRPDVVASHDPWTPYRLHPDHRACGFAACDAVAVAREPLAYPDLEAEGLPAHRPAHLWLFETVRVDHVETIGASLDAKVDALLAHRSQYRSTMGARGDEDSAGLATFAARIRRWAQDLGALGGVDRGEVFAVVGT